MLTKKEKASFRKYFHKLAFASGAARRGESKVPVPGPQPSIDEPGKARDEVAEALGISGSSVDRGVRVVDAIDEFEAAGEREPAQRLKSLCHIRDRLGGGIPTPEQS